MRRHLFRLLICAEPVGIKAKEPPKGLTSVPRLNNIAGWVEPGQKVAPRSLVRAERLLSNKHNDHAKVICVHSQTASRQADGLLSQRERFGMYRALYGLYARFRTSHELTSHTAPQPLN